MRRVASKALGYAALCEHVLTLVAAVAVVADLHLVEAYSTSGLVVAGVVTIIKERR